MNEKNNCEHCNENCTGNCETCEENCNHDCANCSENCSGRIEKAVPTSDTKIGKIIAVLSGKGGVGKSMVTALMAHAMKEKGKTVAILDADKEGFLRSETSLVQTIGRAARNENGEVIMYADSVTPSMERAITETLRRRGIQEAYNAEHGITPTTIKKDVREIIEITSKDNLDKNNKRMTRKERQVMIEKLTREMKEAARMLEFEHAAFIRDKIKELSED